MIAAVPCVMLEVGEIPNRESRLKNVSLVRALLPAGGEDVAVIAAVPLVLWHEKVTKWILSAIMIIPLIGKLNWLLYVGIDCIMDDWYILYNVAVFALKNKEMSAS